MFERYNEKARRVIFFARYVASQYGSPFIETEHLLLGLLKEDPSLLSLLPNAKSLDEIRREIERHIEPRERISTSVDLRLSGQCKRALNFSPEEANRLASRQIEPEHLLLGLLRIHDGLAAQILGVPKHSATPFHSGGTAVQTFSRQWKAFSRPCAKEIWTASKKFSAPTHALWMLVERFGKAQRKSPPILNFSLPPSPNAAQSMFPRRIPPATRRFGSAASSGKTSTCP